MIEIECALRFKGDDDCERTVVEKSAGVDDVPAWFGRTIADALLCMGRSDTALVIAHMVEWLVEDGRHLSAESSEENAQAITTMVDAAQWICALRRQARAGTGNPEIQMRSGDHAQ
jgi:hypothetical protein